MFLFGKMRKNWKNFAAKKRSNKKENRGTKLFPGRVMRKNQSFFISMFRATRVSTSMRIYRQPMVIKMAGQPK